MRKRNPIERPATQGRRDQPSPARDQSVESRHGDIVVNGRAIHCREAPGDPHDRVSIPGWPEYLMIVPAERGGFIARRANEWITGPEFWQRVGVNMGAYRF